MKTYDLMQRLAQIHNQLMNVSVSGENAILLGNTILNIRSLLQDIENEAKKESTENAD